MPPLGDWWARCVGIGAEDVIDDEFVTACDVEIASRAVQCLVADLAWPTRTEGLGDLRCDDAAREYSAEALFVGPRAVGVAPAGPDPVVGAPVEQLKYGDSLRHRGGLPEPLKRRLLCDAATFAGTSMLMRKVRPHALICG
jgi:hypothetical protein